MTNLTPEQIREAVELLDWEITDDSEACNGFWYRAELTCQSDNAPDIKEVHSSWEWVYPIIASQLISQVDAMGFHVEVYSGSMTGIYDEYEQELAAVSGPNHDDNSLLACTEFLRGR